MGCEQLQRLREAVTALTLDLKKNRLKAQQARSQDRRASARPSSDLIVYKERRLQRAVSELQKHISHHNCQE